MSLAEFGTILGTLAVATGRTMDDETIDVYFGSLKDVPVGTFQAAVGRLINSSKFFPSVGEIRASCDRVGAGKAFATFTVPALPSGAPRDDDPRVWYACVTCQDSGWASHWCPGSVNVPVPNPDMFIGINSCGSNACARFGVKGYGHEYVKRCLCFSTNPKIRERLEARRKYTETEA